MNTRSSLKTGASVLFLIAGFFACNPTPDPAALPAPALSLSRVFTYTDPARKASLSYGSDQLTASASHSTSPPYRFMFTMQPARPVRVSQQVGETFFLTLPYADFPPGQTGTYALDADNPQFDNQRVSIDYAFGVGTASQSGSPGSSSTYGSLANRFEPSSRLTISEYNQSQGLISGTFALVFFVATDPVEPKLGPLTPNDRVLVTLDGTFANVPVRISQ
jgi:hypothetical protein